MSSRVPPTFGAGGGEPYGAALDDDRRTLTLHEYRDAGGTIPRGRRIDVGRFLAPADAADGEVILAAEGPVLDVGCGPGRMVRAAAARGHLVLGIDVSAVAVRIARRHGLPVLRRSVFEPLPGLGRWGTAILMDGNIGIEGDPVALLRRCRDLVHPRSGRVVVETSPDPFDDRAVRSLVVDDLGRRSAPFAWAEVGAVALRRHAGAAGLEPQREWTTAGRSFAAYARA